MTMDCGVPDRGRFYSASLDTSTKEHGLYLLVCHRTNRTRPSTVRFLYH
jgi:hypothetical protein